MRQQLTREDLQRQIKAYSQAQRPARNLCFIPCLLDATTPNAQGVAVVEIFTADYAMVRDEQGKEFPVKANRLTIV